MSMPGRDRRDKIATKPPENKDDNHTNQNQSDLICNEFQKRRVMTTEQEIIDQITMTEAALEESETKVHKAVIQDDEARLARSGKSTDLELKEAAERASERLQNCRDEHLNLVQSLRRLNTELALHRERQRIACQEMKHQYMRDHLPEAIADFQEAAVKLMALQGIVTENVITADAIQYISDRDLHQRAMDLQAEMLNKLDTTK
jgi:hypothetical protein